ncbi:MAG TPA: GAF domain-containing protein [Verrucomicrobiota bacterium]|nr:GAF domain-containing protein [Verrucomicrobiota bacterium]
MTEVATASEETRVELEQCRQRIRELARAEVLLAGENRILEAVARGVALTDILASVCRLIEESSPGSLCGILLYDAANNRVEHGAAPSLPEAYNRAIHHRTVTPEAGPCGTALCLKEQIIAADIASDARWDTDGWRSLALEQGLRACWSTPILYSGGTALGTFALYWREPRSPTARDQKLIEQVSHLAAVAIERRRIEERLRRNERGLIEAIDTIPGLVWSVLPDGEVDFLNQRWREYTGLTLEQARGWGWRAAIHPDDLDRLEVYWRSTLASGQPGETEARLRRYDGSHRWFLFRAVPLFDESGKLVKWYGQNTDIDDRKRAEALLAGEKQVLEMIARGEGLSSILDTLCRIVESVSPDTLASIMLLDQSSNRLWHAASPSLPRGYTDGMGGIKIGPSVGSCGTAVHRREPVIVCDIATDPLWADYRSVALAHGLKASWSTPIFSSTCQILGTFALLAREPRSPTAEHHQISSQITHLASIAIDRKRAEQRLRQSEAYLKEAQRLSLTGSFGLKVATGELVWSDETFCIMAYDRTITPTLDLVWQRIHPDDLCRVRETIERANREEIDSDFEHRLLLPDGRIKHVRVMARAMKSERGELEFVGAVMDITERKKAAEALHASEHLARGQAEALRLTQDSLARETVSDRMVEHVMRAVTLQLKAHSSSVWLKDETTGLMTFEFALENGEFRTKADSNLAAVSPSLPVDAVWPWPEVFRTGQSVLLEDIRTGMDFPWRQHVLAQGIISILIVPMLVSGKVAGVIGLRFQEKRSFRTGELELAQAMANQAMLAVQLMRLSQANREAAVIAERNRLARDMHDTLAQGFTGVIMQLEAAKGAMASADAASAVTHIERAEALARSSLGEARRSVRAMRTRSLVDGTLSTALDDLLKRMTSGTELQAELAVRGLTRPMPPACEEGLLRIAQESLTNTIKYAKARRFSATLSFLSGAVQLQLADDGCGFDPRAESDGFGLIGMRERTEQMAGQFVLRSKPGEGTEIVVELNQSDAGNGSHEKRQD